MMSEDALTLLLWVVMIPMAIWGWILMIRGENVFSRRRRY